MYKKILKSLWFQIPLSLLIIIAVSLSIYLKTDPDRTAQNRILPDSQIKGISGSLPMRFEKNEGQAGRQADFLSRAENFTALLSSTEVLLSLQDPESRAQTSKDQTNREQTETNTLKTTSLLEMQLVGGNTQSEADGLDKLVTKSNYFIGNDPAKWRTDIPNYAKVKYSDVYPGIDLEYYGNQGRLEYDFIISPGSEPDVISLQFEGMDSITKNQKGELVLRTGLSEMIMQEPIAYQEREGMRELVPAAYTFKSEDLIAFSVGDYDPDIPLVIDPVIVYSTYLGGAGPEVGRAITVDTLGNVYLTGSAGWGFPVDDNPIQANNAGAMDVFVAKLKADGSALLYATYIGGSEDGSGLGGDDVGRGIAIDPEGNVYITGSTQSDDFPMQNALQTTYRGDDMVYSDAFVVKLNPTGTALLYSTYLGGDEDEIGHDIQADKSGHAYVVGMTTSDNFPVKYAYDASLNGSGDAFISKIQPDGSDFVFSTFLGGESGDGGRGIAIDREENIYLTGSTSSADFPLVSAYQESGYGGDAFVTKMNAAGTGLAFSTFLTGTGTDDNYSHNDVGTSIAVDTLGYVYVAGMTQSPDFPNDNAVQANIGGTPDGFVTKFNPDGSSLVYSTYLGGSHWEGGLDIEVDYAGNAYIAGSTQSSDFKTENPLQSTLSGLVDVFVVKIDPLGADMVFSTYLGGSNSDGWADWDAKDGIAVDQNRNVYVTSRTNSADFPTKDSLQGTFGGSGDAFVTKIDIDEKINWIEITSNYTLAEGIRVFEGSRTSPKLKAYYIDADLNRSELSVRPYIRGLNDKKNVKDFNQLVNAHASINGGFFYRSSAYLSAVVYPYEVKSRNVDSVKRKVNNVERWYPVLRGFFGLKKDRSLSVDWIYHITHQRNGIYTFTEPFPYTINDTEPIKEPKDESGTEYSNLLTGIGGGPVLIKNNSIRVTYAEEVLWGGSGVEYGKQDPRSAVGYTANKHVIMLVADGRSDESKGVDLPELAQIMSDLGCVEALNLDGGGSSQMAIGNAFVNKPSDAYPRVVPSILSIVHSDNVQIEIPDWVLYRDTHEDATEIVGGWTESTDPGAYGSSNALVIPSGEGENHVLYNLELSQEAECEVYAWWVAGPDRSEDAPYIIYHKDGLDTVRVVQTINGSFWNYIGNFTFTGTASDMIKITDGSTTGGVICADAIRIVSYDESTGISRPSLQSAGTFKLLQNYPNPFNRETQIDYQLLSRSDVKINVFNMKGQKIKTLINEIQSAGRYSVTWDGTGMSGDRVSSGIYFVQMEADGYKDMKQMILTRF